MIGNRPGSNSQTRTHLANVLRPRKTRSLSYFHNLPRSGSVYRTRPQSARTVPSNSIVQCRRLPVPSAGRLSGVRHTWCSTYLIRSVSRTFSCRHPLFAVWQRSCNIPPRPNWTCCTRLLTHTIVPETLFGFPFPPSYPDLLVGL